MNYMEEANLEALKNSKNSFKNGGPFGAVIVRDGKIISRAHNQVLKTNDPTSHAEVNAIRKACKKLKTHDLKDCILYTSCEPCPMCLSASIWANVKQIYYGNTRSDANEIGFRDDFIYEVLKENPITKYPLTQMNRDKTIKVFEDFKNNSKLY